MKSFFGKVSVILIIGAFLVTGCSKKMVSHDVTKKDLIGKSFVLTKVDGKSFTSPLEGKNPLLGFNEDFHLFGLICNNLMGNAKLDKGKLVVDKMASTLMMCPFPELEEFEQLFGSMLQSGVDVSFDNEKFILKQGGHELVFIPDNTPSL